MSKSPPVHIVLGLAIGLVAVWARADWPARVFAPYMYLGTGQADQLTQCNGATGQLYFTLAFIIADRENNPAWYGRVAMDGNYYADQIAAIRAKGGDVIVSFGGEGGTELAIAETDPQRLLSKYQSIIDRYKFTWLDFDIEGNGLKDTAANERRNSVLAKLQAANKGLRISYTLPGSPDGIGRDSQHLLTDAKAKGVNVYSANIMTMYFGPRFSRGKKMSDVSFASATKAYEQCQAIDPQIKIGLTPLIGLNRQMDEDFTLDDARAMVRWSLDHPWICSLSFWSGDRDSGRRRGRNNAPAAAPTTAPAGEPWAYTSVFKQFTGRGS
jgi:hypothetical protein